jgi:hypothetical protein
MYLKDANYIALRRARVARCWKESVLGRRRTGSPATGGLTSSPATPAVSFRRLNNPTQLPLV